MNDTKMSSEKSPEAQSQIEAVTQKKEEKPGPEQPPIRKAIQKFVTDMRAIADAFPVTIRAVQDVNAKAKADFEIFLENRAKKVPADNTDESKFEIAISQWPEFKEIFEKFIHSQAALVFIPRSSLTTLVSQFDAYVGHLLKAIFLMKPEAVNALGANISFKEVLDLGSIDDARDYIIEREIDSILRSSHYDQIKWFEDKLKIHLIKKYDKFCDFIETTERRNLFVHTDGRISRQYLKVCKSHGIDVNDDKKVGEILSVDRKYIEHANAVLFEVGVLLGHLAWRKLKKEEIRVSDSHLIEITYDSIKREKYDVAIRILEFVLNNFGKLESERTQLTHVINLANSYRLAGNKERCAELMKRHDWRAKGFEFRMAEAVLSENYSAATNLMERIGSAGEIDKEDYRRWPLFIGFRETPEFLKTFEKIFGETFAFTQPSPTHELELKADEVTQP